ncbi:hypothetical protein [Nocardia brasiliensis]|nr:hypothetical protein [Nocardia brasiliensis]
MLRESDDAGSFNIRLIERIAGHCLHEGLVVVVEGILGSANYGPMLERLASATAGPADSVKYWAPSAVFGARVALTGTPYTVRVRPLRPSVEPRTFRPSSNPSNTPPAYRVGRTSVFAGVVSALR